MNDSERKASENTEDLSFLSETGVLEALTDEDIAEEPEYLGETGVLETLTVNDAKKMMKSIRNRKRMRKKKQIL